MDRSSNGYNLTERERSLEARLSTVRGVNRLRLAYVRGKVNATRLRDAERDLLLLDSASGYHRDRERYPVEPPLKFGETAGANSQAVRPRKTKPWKSKS
jgi:hypothetical protein